MEVFSVGGTGFLGHYSVKSLLARYSFLDTESIRDELGYLKGGLNLALWETLEACRQANLKRNLWQTS